MWIVKMVDEGKDYGEYQVGFFEPIGNDQIFRHSGYNFSGFLPAAQLCNYLNGGNGFPFEVKPTITGWSGIGAKPV